MDSGFIAFLLLGCFIAIPLTIYLFSCLVEKIKDSAPSTRQLNADLEAKNKELDSKIKECTELKAFLDSRASDFSNELQTLIDQQHQYYPQLASAMADLLMLHYEKAADYLTKKSRPAYTEAHRIRSLRKETAEILKQKKEIEYMYSHILQMYPDIIEIFDSGFYEEQSMELEADESTDRVSLLLSLDEYQNLSITERNQLALDRYLAGRKSKWQIGRDYELYIGYQYEQQGFHVKYSGILENLEDMGRDLIVTKQDKTYIIQCKNWSKTKTIHEKHIFQLFGTVVLYNIDHPRNPAVGVFVTTTQLSDKAMKIAKELSIQVVHKETGDFPRIKCNINRTSGERIYHLPFDQQYDRTVVDTSKGECYALTVKEAETKGFRRSFKHCS